MEGGGYWLQGGQARELNSGDGFVVAGGAQAVVRASQLGPLRMQFFTVQPHYLNGLLTVGEGRQLESLGQQGGALTVVFAAGEPLGQRFKHVAQLPPGDSLALRCALLQLWSGAVAGLLQACPVAVAVGNKLRERFRDYIAHMSEAELASRPLPDLAREIHCSERHFSRLFREEFGEPLRTRQIELRLQRARQLLLDSDDKIIHIAYESGYRHLGLFNAMFKKRFGMTPSEWRHQNLKAAPAVKPSALRLSRRVTLAAAWLAVAYAGVTLPAWAGSTNAPAAKQFTLLHYDVTGNTILPPEVIARVLTNSPGAFGTNVTLEGLQGALGRLKLEYRERGYATVDVSLPQQKLTNATVRVKVTEGRLSAIRVTGNNYFSSNNVMRALPSLHTNELLNAHIFQRELDTANESRDRTIYPVLSPGPDPGTTLLTLKVKDQLPLHGRVEINNAVTPSTPGMRIAANAQYDNLWDLEHQAGLSYSFSPGNFSRRDYVPFEKAGNFITSDDYRITPFDSPLVVNYSVYYQIPLGGYTAVAQEVDRQPSRFGYNEVSHTFELPPNVSRPELTIYASRSRNDTGIQETPPDIKTALTATTQREVYDYSYGQNFTANENVGLKYTLPLPPVARVSSTFGLGLDYKRYLLSVYNSLVTVVKSYTTINGTLVPAGVPSYDYQFYQTHTTALDYLPFNVSWSGSRPDAHGSTAFNTRLDFNFLPVEATFNQTNPAPAANRLSSASYSSGVRNNYLKLTAGVDRVQNVYRDWTVKLHADGQWATSPLFSNEQFGMGGMAGVRGYSEGDFYGDTGWRVSVEPQTPMIDLGMVDGNLPLWVRSSIFMDYGEVYHLDGAAAAASGSPARQAFWGVGWTLTANIGNHWDGRLTLACPLISSPTTPVGDVHVYFGVGAQF